MGGLGTEESLVVIESIHKDDFPKNILFRPRWKTNSSSHLVEG